MEKKQGTKLAIIFLTAILAAAIFSVSALSQDFSGYKYPDEKFSLNGDNFTLKIDKSETTLITGYNDENLIIGRGECQNTDSNLYRICFNHTLIDFNSKSNVGKISETGDLIPGIYVKITYNKPVITLTRTFSNTKPEILEEVYANVTIKNAGKTPAEFTYTEKIPDNFQIVKSNGFSIYQNQLTLNARVGTLSSSTFVYSIKPLNYSSAQNIQGNLSYIYETVKGVLTTAKATITPIESVKLSAFGQEITDLNEEASLKINITNTFDELLSINFSVEIPKSVKVISVPQEIKKIGETSQYLIYNQQLRLTSSASEIKEIKIKPILSGNQTIRFSATYAINGIKQLSEKSATVNVKIGKIVPQIILDKDNITSNEILTLKIKIRNNDTKNTFYEMNSDLVSNFFKKTFYTPVLSPNDEFFMYEYSIRMPILNTTQKTSINFTGSYNTKNNEKINFSISKNIAIIPIQEALHSSYDMDKSKNKTGETGIIVSIENEKDDDIRVNSEDLVSGISVNGETSKTIILTKFSKKQFYSYTLNTDNANIAEQKIINRINYTEGDTEFIIEREVIVNLKNKTVKMKDPVIKQETEVKTNQVVGEKAVNSLGSSSNDTAKGQNSKTSTPQKNTPESKETFFSKIVNFFKNLI